MQNERIRKKKPGKDLEHVPSKRYNTMPKGDLYDEDIDLGKSCLTPNCKCSGFKPHPWSQLTLLLSLLIVSSGMA
uniref:Uncharacterized protein n=1 Tax=Setaria digitata TaxID=48799 RepID=A0A915PPS2_9BILA